MMKEKCIGNAGMEAKASGNAVELYGRNYGFSPFHICQNLFLLEGFKTCSTVCRGLNHDTVFFAFHCKNGIIPLESADVASELSLY